MHWQHVARRAARYLCFMRFRFFLLFALPVLLCACAKTDAPVRLDFIGNSALTSGNRTAGAGDTLTTRAYAMVGKDNTLTRLRITVQYEPTRTPFLYPVPATSYNPANTPNDNEVVYLDSTLARASAPNPDFTGPELIFQNKFSSRTTSGTELWRYVVTDAKDQTANRALRLTVRKPDSLAVFHNYTAILRPVPPGPGTVPAAELGQRDRARVFLNLRSGLVLAKYSLLNLQNGLQANQPLVDLICVASGTGLSLNAPAATSMTGGLNASRWPLTKRNRTRLLNTSLSVTDFGNAKTTNNFVAAFAGGTPLAPDSLSTGPLAKNKVLAFRTAEGLTGLILIVDLIPGASPVLNGSIKVQKQ